jgi:hypothetical protein
MANYNFQVTPTVTNGQTSWNLCLEKGSTCDQSAAANVNVGNVQNPSFKFKINDSSGQFTFAPDTPPPNQDGPLWIQFGSKPTAYVVDGQINTPNGGGSTSLNFVDKNTDQGVLKYRLNFVDKQGTKSSLDPDITNGGHGIISPAELMIAAAVVAALVSAVITLLLAPWVARRAVR